jgi:hypothetical protein
VEAAADRIWASANAASLLYVMARLRKVSMPYWLAFTIGRFMEIFAALTFKQDDPPLSRSLVRMIGREFTVDDSAARRDLGYVGEMTGEPVGRCTSRPSKRRRVMGDAPTDRSHGTVAAVCDVANDCLAFSVLLARAGSSRAELRMNVNSDAT